MSLLCAKYVYKTFFKDFQSLFKWQYSAPKGSASWISLLLEGSSCKGSFYWTCYAHYTHIYITFLPVDLSYSLNYKMTQPCVILNTVHTPYMETVQCTLWIIQLLYNGNTKKKYFNNSCQLYK